MDEKLKPCPFCGGTAELDYGLMNIYTAMKKSEEPKGCHEVRCTKCGISTEWKIDASQRWNRRTAVALSVLGKERARCEDIVCGFWPDQQAIRAAILEGEPKEEQE